jgi:hypothetical protein
MMMASLSHNRTRVGLLAAAFASGVLVAGVLVLSGVRAHDEGNLTPSGPRQLTDIFDPNKPLMLSGEETTLSDVSTRAGFAIYTPQDAADSSPEVWYSADTSEVALRYDTDLVLLLTPWPIAAEVDAAAPYEAQAKEMGVGYTAKITEHPAWVLPSAGETEGDGSVSVVHLMIDGIDVTLYGTMPVDDLVKLAESVQ